MKEQTIVVVGAGIGGLSAAIRLALAGKRVVVFEQSGAVGGKMSEYRAEGFRWDTGPSVITMRHVFDDLFTAAGRRIDDYLTLLPVDPLTRYFYSDGVIFDATSSLTQIAANIAQIDERDVEGYLAYLAYAARIHRITGEKFIYNDPPTLGQLLRTPFPDSLHVDSLRTMDGAIRGFVRSPHLRQLLGRFATYVGASPFLAPATLNVIAHVELTGGVWYPQGGVYAIAQAFEKLARELGVEICTDSPVERIEVKNGSVQGVWLSDRKDDLRRGDLRRGDLRRGDLPGRPYNEGTFIPAAAVVANVDVAAVYERLLPPDAVYQRRLKQLTSVEPSCSGFILMLGVEGTHAQFAHHNIFFSSDYRREFDDIFRRGVPPDEPTIYVAITSKTDASHAPDGCENWFVLVNAPPLDSRFDWTREAEGYREVVLSRLATFGVDVRKAVRVERMLTPLDIERLTGARRGELYGASSNSKFSALRRPHNRAPDVQGLYFAGGTAHPGGGVPMVTLSGKAAARMILQDFS